MLKREYGNGRPNAWIAAVVVSTALCSAAFAQARRDTPAPTPAPASVPGTPPITTSPSVEVTGFRSARFGMNEKDVRAAIMKDFGVKADAIRSEVNPSEQTNVLLVRANDVLPGGGMAEVSYVFGFKSKTLIQIGVTWSKAIDEKITPEQLFSNSSVLRAHFLSAGYKPDTIATNMPIGNGILMFRGSDQKDRTTMLVLQGPITKGEKDQRILTPEGLMLFYVADAKQPDIYRLTPGSF